MLSSSYHLMWRGLTCTWHFGNSHDYKSRFNWYYSRVTLLPAFSLKGLNQRGRSREVWPKHVLEAPSRLFFCPSLILFWHLSAYPTNWCEISLHTFNFLLDVTYFVKYSTFDLTRTETTTQTVTLNGHRCSALLSLSVKMFQVEVENLEKI